jgi:hypothetical protein
MRSVVTILSNAAVYPFIITKLKYLYVAITRAKNRLWIIDYCDKDQPLMVRTPTQLPYRSRVGSDG